MADIIVEEIQELIDRLKSESLGDFLVDQTFNIAIFNILWRIVSGKRFQVSVFIKGLTDDDGVRCYLTAQ